MSDSTWKLFYYSDQTSCFIGSYSKPGKSLFLSEIKAQPVRYLHTFHVWCLYKQNQEYANISLARPDDFTIQHWELVSGLFVGASFQGAVPTDEDKTALAHIWIDIKPIRNQLRVNKVTCQELVRRCVLPSSLSQPQFEQSVHRNDSDLDCLIAFLNRSSTTTCPTQDAWLWLARMGHRTHKCKVNYGYCPCQAVPLSFLEFFR